MQCVGDKAVQLKLSIDTPIVWVTIQGKEGDLPDGSVWGETILASAKTLRKVAGGESKAQLARK